MGDRMKRIMIFGAVLVMLAGSAAAQDYQRAVLNYQAVMSGAKKLSDLTPQEQTEVMAVVRAMSRRAPSGASSECRDAWDHAESARSELQDQARRLMRCAENADLKSDDCYSEARRARNAQDDFASAVSSVQSECD